MASGEFGDRSDMGIDSVGELNEVKGSENLEPNDMLLRFLESRF
jgi:hypothetical protein